MCTNKTGKNNGVCTTRERTEWLLPLFVHIQPQANGNLFSLISRFSPRVCVCVFRGCCCSLIILFFSPYLFNPLFFLFFSTFFFSLFKITRPQVVSDRVKADWRKLFLLNYLSSSDIGCSTFSEGLLLLLLLPFGWVGCFVDCAVRGKVIVYWTDSRHTKVAIV